MLFQSKWIRLFYVAVLLLTHISAERSTAQKFTPEFSTRIGYIRNLQTGDAHPKMSKYPELEVAETIYQSSDANWTLLGSVFVGGWFSGDREVCRCTKKPTYSQNSLVYGFRMSLVPRKVNYPIRSSLGLSKHLIRIVADAWGRDGRKDSYESPLYLDFGAELEIPVSESFKILGGIKAYRSLGQSDSNPTSFRPSFHIGVTHASH